jgi:hypothetical protein
MLPLTMHAHAVMQARSASSRQADVNIEAR